MVFQGRLLGEEGDTVTKINEGYRFLSTGLSIGQHSCPTYLFVTEIIGEVIVFFLPVYLSVNIRV